MADERDEDIIVLSQGSAISQDSVKVTIGKIYKPKGTDRVAIETKGPDLGGKRIRSPGDDNSTPPAKRSERPMADNPIRKKKISGAERRRRKKAKIALENEKSALTVENHEVMEKQIQQQNPETNKETEETNQPFKDTVLESLTYVIVGAKGHEVDSEQVKEILKNVVWELERFLGTPTMAPSFKGKRLGESELELRCANERTEEWLKWVFPKLKPWKGASLRLMKKSEWEKKKKMVRMSVIVPWLTSGNYFLEILRSNNPNLKTRDWELKYIEVRGDSTAIFLRIDEESADILRHNNFKAFWLLDEITFVPKRGTKTTERQTNDNKQKANSQPDGNSKDADKTSQSVETETNKSATLANTKEVDINTTPSKTGEVTPTIGRNPTIGASKEDPIDNAGTEGMIVTNSEVSRPNSSSTMEDQSEVLRPDTGTISMVLD